MILILTNKGDAHADMVIRHLHNACIDFFRLNTEDFLESQCSLTFSDDWSGVLYTSKRSLNINAVQSIWYRRPKKPKVVANILEEDVVDFVSRETGVVLAGLWDLLSDRFWINHPRRNSVADNKIAQLRVAQMVGLTIPPSLITTSPTKVMDFVNRYGDVVVKPLGGGFIKREGQTNLIYTNRIDIKNLACISQVTHCPTFFQAYVSKLFELRITVVCGEFFSCKIDSQNSERTRDDWRRYDFDKVDHSSYQLPEEVQTMLENLMSCLGLNFGAIDMIVTPKGEYVFLEINPNGQWGWIEELTGMPISLAITRALMNPSCCF